MVLRGRGALVFCVYIFSKFYLFIVYVSKKGKKAVELSMSMCRIHLGSLVGTVSFGNTVTYLHFHFKNLITVVGHVSWDILI